jgi:multiple sugar transport system permease protein
MAIALALALLVNDLPVFRSFFRSVFFLPVACSYVLGSLVWKLGLFSGLSSGLVNTVLVAVGLDPVSTWLAASPYWWVVLVSVRLWLQVGFYMLLFLAGLQRIPRVLYEAATIDGLSGGPRRFRHITWPQLRPTVAAVLLLLLVAAFQAFDEFINLLPLNPSTRPPLVYLYNVALGSQRDFGLGSAGSLILTGIMVVVALAQNRFFGFTSAEDRPARTRRSRRDPR